MSSLIQLNRVRYLFIAFLLACFAIAQSATAQRQDPNRRTIVINLTTQALQCTPERVRVGGVVQLRFDVNRAFEVVPVQVELQNVRGSGTDTDRSYVPENPNNLRVLDLEVTRPQRLGHGTFRFRFKMIGRPNPLGTADPNPEQIFSFFVEYRIAYDFIVAGNGRGEVTELSVQRGPLVSCQ